MSELHPSELWRLRSSLGTVFFHPVTGIVHKVTEGRDFDSPACTDPEIASIYLVDVERAKVDRACIEEFGEADILYVGYWSTTPAGAVVYEEPLNHEQLMRELGLEEELTA